MDDFVGLFVQGGEDTQQTNDHQNSTNINRGESLML